MSFQKRPFHEDYQLYYGMNTSLINSSESTIQTTDLNYCSKNAGSLNHNRAKSYGLMEDSYYEDSISSGGPYINNLQILNNNSKSILLIKFQFICFNFFRFFI